VHARQGRTNPARTAAVTRCRATRYPPNVSQPRGTLRASANAAMTSLRVAPLVRLSISRIVRTDTPDAAES